MPEPRYGTEGQRFESSRARCRIPLGKGISGRRRTPRSGNTGGNRATLMVLPLHPTEVPGGLPTWFEVRGGLPRRGAPAQAVGRNTGRSRRIKLKRDGEARARRRGPTL